MAVAAGLGQVLRSDTGSLLLRMTVLRDLRAVAGC